MGPYATQTDPGGRGLREPEPLFNIQQPSAIEDFSFSHITNKGVSPECRLALECRARLW